MKFIFGILVKTEVFYKLILSLWVCVTRHAESTQNKFAYLCNITRKALEMRLLFCLQINTKVFYKFIPSFWVCITRHAQSAQSQFTTSLQYFKENIKNGVYFRFLPADKSKRFLQSNTSILGVWPDMSKLHRLTSLLFLCNILRKKQR